MLQALKTVMGQQMIFALNNETGEKKERLLSMFSEIMSHIDSLAMVHEGLGGLYNIEGFVEIANDPDVLENCRMLQTPEFESPLFEAIYKHYEKMALESFLIMRTAKYSMMQLIIEKAELIREKWEQYPDDEFRDSPSVLQLFEDAKSAQEYFDTVAEIQQQIRDEKNEGE